PEPSCACTGATTDRPGRSPVPQDPALTARRHARTECSVLLAVNPRNQLTFVTLPTRDQPSFRATALGVTFIFGSYSPRSTARASPAIRARRSARHASHGPYQSAVASRPQRGHVNDRGSVIGRGC